MTGEHEVLISLRAFSGQPIELLRDTLKKMRLFLQVQQCSSVYKVKVKGQAANIHDIRLRRSLEGLAVVIRGTTKLSADQLIFRIHTSQEQMDSGATRRSVSLNLLVYDDLTLMSPQLTLPHPELHLRPEELVPAAEVFGEYYHPVLEQPLYALAERFREESWGEFFAQGQTLLDFSQSDA